MEEGKNSLADPTSSSPSSLRSGGGTGSCPQLSSEWLHGLESVT